jgi:hypothetical protein
MSHIVRIKTQIRDPVAVQAACTRMRIPPPEQGTFQLYTSAATGWAVRLPDWQYPVVCQTESGELAYDSFNGAWGDMAHLERFQQAYAVEKVRLEARRQHCSITEQPLRDGSVRLTIHTRSGS